MKWRATFAAIVIILSALVVSGAEPVTEPATGPATGAATHASTTATAPAADAPPATTLDQATGRFETALRKAREQYLRDLTELKRRAVKADNFPAANEINALIEQLSGGNAVAPPVRLSTVTRALVRADQDWQRSPVLVRAGDTLRITANGEWIVNDRDPQLTTSGPDGLRRDGTADFHGMWSILWAKVGYKVYFVGK